MRRSPGRVLLAVALIVVGLGVIHFAEPGAQTRWLRDVLNSSHALVFGVIALLLLFAFNALGVTGARAYLAALLGVFLLGALSEFLQLSNPLRNPSIGDWLRDVGGAVVCLCVTAIWRREAARPGPIAALAVLATLSLAALIGPLLMLWQDYRGRDAAFPVLCCLTGDWESRFLRSNHLELEPAVPPGVEGGAGYQRLRFSPAYWPGLTLKEVHPDWSGYDVLAFDIYTEAPPAVELVLRIDDYGYDGVSFEDRFNRDLELAPGLNRFRIPIEEIVSAPAGRRMDARRMKKIILFGNQPDVPFEIYWNGFRLLPDSRDAAR